MALNLTLLRSFHAVAQSGSVSRAAQSAFISQPALSKAIKELERQLGTVLLERGSRGVTLTEAGQVLFDYSKAIFALEQEAEDALGALGHLERGTLRIGASTTVATTVLPPVLAQFRALHPGLRFSLVRDNSRGIEERLLDFALDVALVEGPPHTPHIEKRLWRDEALVAVCAPTHPLAARARVQLDDLKTCTWLVRERGSGTREVVEEALKAFGLPPDDALEITGSETLRQAVAANLGVAFVSSESAADQIALGKLRVLPLDISLRRPFYLLRLPNRPLSAAARAFEKFLLLDS